MEWPKIIVSMLLCWTVTTTASRTIDGDTFVANLPIWMDVMLTNQHVRVLGVQTPEKRIATMEGWLSAKAFTQNWLSLGSFTITACAKDSFGRPLGTVMRGEDSLAADLIAAGQGVPDVR